MSDVILYGTLPNGEAVRVEANEMGQLVAEGLPGQPGQPGEPGPPGPPGPPGEIDLPPDPYEGALLGWQNDQLAWIGNAPIPLPARTVGPIISYDQNQAIVTVDGGDPALLIPGLNVFMSDENGTEVTGIPVTSDLESFKENGGQPILYFQTEEGLVDFHPGDGFSDGSGDSFLPEGQLAIYQYDSTNALPPKGQYLYPGENANTYEVDDFPNGPIKLEWQMIGGSIGNIGIWHKRPEPGSEWGRYEGYGYGSSVNIQELFSMGGTVCFFTYNNGINFGGCVFSARFINEMKFIVPIGTVIPGPVVIQCNPADKSLFVTGGTYQIAEPVYGLKKQGKAVLGDNPSSSFPSLQLVSDNGEWMIGKYLTQPEARVAPRLIPKRPRTTREPRKN